MSAFFLFDNIEVTDPEKLGTYVETVGPVVEKFGGKYRVIGGGTEILEGDWQPTYPVVIEFESKEKALAWYNSEEYQPFKALRQSAVKCNGTLFEGL